MSRDTCIWEIDDPVDPTDGPGAGSTGSEDGAERQAVEGQVAAEPAGHGRVDAPAE